MRATRGTGARGFTVIEILITLVVASLLIGMVTMAVRVSIETRNRRADQNTVIQEAREGLDTIERLLHRAVELPDWDAQWNYPTLTNGSGVLGDHYLVRRAGTQDFGAGPVTFQIGEMVMHNGTRWLKPDANPSGNWDPAGPGLPGAAGTPATGTIWLVTGSGTDPALIIPPGGPPPSSHVIPGDRIQKVASGQWNIVSYRADINWPPLGGPLPSSRYVSAPSPNRTISGIRYCFAVGDRIVRTPFGFEKACVKSRLRNFKSRNTASNADDNIEGIQFYADVDPDGTGGPQFATLEWVWIWWDSSVELDQKVQPYERRGPIKVAIFRNEPFGGVGNTPDSWTRPSHPFFTLVNQPTKNSRKAYYTTAANFGSLSMKVQEYLVTTSSGSYTKQRVAITGGVFLDRSEALASVPNNPWDEVAPGSPLYFPISPSTPVRPYALIPSYTINRTIYPANLDAATDSTGRPFNVGAPNSFYSQLVLNSVSWNTLLDATSIKNDFVVNPR